MASLQGTRPEACLEKHLVKRPLDKYHLDTRTRTFFSTFAKLDIRKKLLFVNVKTVLLFAIMKAHVASVSLFGQKIVQTISHFLVIEKNCPVWDPTFLFVHSNSLHDGTGKVKYTKYSKHWHNTLAHTIDWLCSKMWNNGSNHGLSISFYKLMYVY